jgi:hypothetical protein
MLAAVVSSLAVVAAVSYAENGHDLMTGTWKLNLPRSSGALQRSETLVIPIADGIHDYAEDLTRADGSLAKHEIMRSTTTGSSTRRLTGRPVKRSTKS